MRLRESPYVLRIHTSKKKFGHEEYYAELLLFYPFWKEETDLPIDEIGCKNLFLANFDLLKQNRQKLFPYSTKIEEMKILLEESDSSRPEYIYDTLDGEGQQENLDDKDLILPIDDSELPQELPEHENLGFVDPDHAKL